MIALLQSIHKSGRRLWDQWKDLETGETISSATLIVTAANDFTRPIHDRMPVVLEPEVLEEWLDPDNRDKPELESLLVPSPAGTLVRRAVGRSVGNVRNDGPELIEPVEE